MKVIDTPILFRKFILPSLVSLLVACGSDDNNHSDETLPPANTAPVASPTSAQAVMGTNVFIDAISNDTDADNDPLTLTEVVILEGSGTGVIQGNMLLFTPEKPGIVVFDYTVADPYGATDYSTVTITVTEAEMTTPFVGTQTCLSCHTDKSTFLQTGHNFKLSKIENGEAPKFPFTSLEGSIELLHGADNSVGTPNSWEDVSYVIGGYYRTAMFLDSKGFILAGEGVRVQVPENGEDFSLDHIAPYAPGDAPDAHIFNCGRCHTTGWKDYTAGSDLNPKHQDDLVGIDGTFEQTGIQCEACHGAGAKHANSMLSEDITLIAKGRYTADMVADDMGFGQAMACAECHSKRTNRTFPTYVSEYNQTFGGDTLGGRTIPYDIGGRVAADALLGLDADTGVASGKKREMACHLCHNPHLSNINRDMPGHENAITVQCTDCHGEKAFIPELEIHRFEATCESCHMPADKHFFKINLEHAADSPKNFSSDGKFVQPWNTSKDSCSSCHSDYDARAALIKKMHQ